MITLKHGSLAIYRMERKKATDLLFLRKRQQKWSLKGEESKRTLLDPLSLEVIEACSLVELTLNWTPFWSSFPWSSLVPRWAWSLVEPTSSRALSQSNPGRAFCSSLLVEPSLELPLQVMLNKKRERRSEERGRYRVKPPKKTKKKKGERSTHPVTFLPRVARPSISLYLLELPSCRTSVLLTPVEYPSARIPVRGNIKEEVSTRLSGKKKGVIERVNSPVPWTLNPQSKVFEPFYYGLPKPCRAV